MRGVTGLKGIIDGDFPALQVNSRNSEDSGAATLMARQPSTRAERTTSSIFGTIRGRINRQSNNAGHASQRDPFFLMRPELFKTLKRQGTLGLRENAERRMRYASDDSYETLDRKNIVNNSL